MKRGGFLKSIAMLAVAPEIIAKMEFKPPLISSGATTGLFNDLHFIVPDYLPKLIEKYGNTNWVDEMELMRKDKIQNPKLYECFNDNKL